MSRGLFRVIAVGLFAVITWAGSAPPAWAVKEFFAELTAKYVKPDSKKKNDVLLTIAVEQARCTICHPGDDHRKLSQYGGQVAWRVNKFDKNNKKRIQEALEQVGNLKSDFRDPKSPTYNMLFKQGKLPPQPQR